MFIPVLKGCYTFNFPEGAVEIGNIMVSESITHFTNVQVGIDQLFACHPDPDLIEYMSEGFIYRIFKEPAESGRIHAGKGGHFFQTYIPVIII